MELDKIKKAVEVLVEEMESGDLNITSEKYETYQTLIDLAETVVKVGGIMPEKKDERRWSNGVFSHRDTEAIAHNQAIDACTLAISGAMEGLEEVMSDYHSGNMTEAKKISKAIRTKVLGEER